MTIATASSELTHARTISTLQTIPVPQQVVAFVNLPNFKPEGSVNNGVLQVSFPVSLLEGPFNEILRANGGRYKDTAFQRLDVSDMRVAFTDGGLIVNGNWRIQARELIAS